MADLQARVQQALSGSHTLERELGGGIGAAAVSLATAVSMARIFCGKHHVVDVIAGAGMGITAANIISSTAPAGRSEA